MPKKKSTQSLDHEFERGYFCAVAVLLREEGCVSANVQSLFTQGGPADYADTDDVELFRQHGLMPKA